MLRNTNITKLIAAGLAAGALAGPATAGAVPILDGNGAASGQTVAGQAVAAGGGSDVSSRDFPSQGTPPILPAPDNVDRVAPSQGTRPIQPAPDNVDRVAPSPGTQDLTAPDNVDRKAPGAEPVPAWPTHAQPLTPPAQPAAAPSSSDDGVDTAVWIAAAGGVALVGIAAGLAFRLRPRTRQRSLA
jgi:hypothetical protein